MRYVVLGVDGLGHLPGSSFSALAAVEVTGDRISHSKLFNIDLDSCEKAGLKIYPRDMLYFMSAGDNGDRLLRSQEGSPLPLRTALEQLWHQFARENTQFWASIETFVLVEHAARVCDVRLPWKPWQRRDLATLMNLVVSRVEYVPPRSLIESVEQDAMIVVEGLARAARIDSNDRSAA